MKAMVLEGQKKCRLIQLVTYNQKREVLIKNTHAGICGTDTKIYEEKSCKLSGRYGS